MSDKKKTRVPDTTRNHPSPTTRTASDDSINSIEFDKYLFGVHTRPQAPAAAVSVHYLSIGVEKLSLHDQNHCGETGAFRILQKRVSRPSYYKKSLNNSETRRDKTLSLYYQFCRRLIF